MKLLTICLLIASLSFAQEMPKKIDTTEPAITMLPTDKSVIVIDPKMRAKDLSQAFNILRKEKPTLKIMVHTTSSTLQGVTDLIASEGGTLLIVKMFSNQGIRTQIVPVEQIMEIGYSP